ncbi:MAG: 8-oxo-dGTP pyrophosphatase MutT (NUDIX family) [Sphingobacteriales bacterium]|jgi:8-oxo-dGTP pyrophosphatase MutT (NUDIX family)
MYKIYINDLPFLIANPENIKKNNDLVICRDLTPDEPEALRAMINLLNKKEINGVFISTENPEEMFEVFSREFHKIEAAGGIVKNEKEETLFIKRLGKWDLPKGKIEKGEKIKEAAIREVEEECGVSGLKITSEAKITYHTYPYKGKTALKITYWFKMECDNQQLTPQTEEDITAAVWLSAKDMPGVVKNTYRNIEDLVSGIY